MKGTAPMAIASNRLLMSFMDSLVVYLTFFYLVLCQP